MGRSGNGSRTAQKLGIASLASRICFVGSGLLDTVFVVHTVVCGVLR